MTERLSIADLAAFRRGDERYFQHLARDHSPLLRTIADAHGLDPDEVEDVVQQTWIRVWERRATFANRGSFDGWIVQICRRVSLQTLRCHRSAGGQRASVADASACWRSVIHSDAHAFAAGERRQSLMDWIDDRLAALPSLQRRAAALRWLLEWPVADVAEYLGVAPGTVKASLHRARGKLRSEFGVAVARGDIELEDAGSGIVSAFASPSRTRLRARPPAA